ncbi:MAG: indole-3-glycerol phosphate synthase TrpC, partial [Candidatus Gastranaerophilaceae bacterium]
MNILEKIAETTIKRTETLKTSINIEQYKNKALNIKNDPFLFEKALKKDKISFICEIKKASPSKGIIAEDFPYLDIAKEYEKAGADAISVLTEPEYFMGSAEYLEQIVNTVKTPILRKDFIIDEIQIYETKIIGASGMLLICSLLDERTLTKYIKIADELGISCLVEAHNEEEIKKALNSNARIIGVNNRNLKDFTVDVHNSERLRRLVPDDVLFIAE